MLDSKLCVVNGRVSPGFNNYTSISSKGKAVVDYFFVPIDNLSSCKQFKVHTSRDLVDKYCNLGEIHTDVSNIPDHSALVLEVTTGFEHECIESERVTIGTDVNQSEMPHVTANLPSTFYKRHHIKTVPEGFMSSELNRHAMLLIIECLETCRHYQAELDNIYKDFCKTY